MKIYILSMLCFIIAATTSNCIAGEDAFYGTYSMNHDGWTGTLDLWHNPAYDSAGGQYNLAGTYTGSDGREVDVLGSTLETTTGENHYWSGERMGNIIKFYADFGDPTEGTQEFIGYLFSGGEAMAGITRWHERPFGFYAIKI